MKNIYSSTSKRHRQIDKAKFHKAKLLLEVYRDAIWRLEEDLCHTREEIGYLGGKHLSSLADFINLDIDSYYTASDKKAYEDRLCSIAESKIIIDAIDTALLRVKDYHDQGQTYYRILYENYISKRKLGQTEIQIRLGLSQSTYYRYKKEAIRLFSTQLWGLILSPLNDIWGHITVAEPSL